MEKIEKRLKAIQQIIKFSGITKEIREELEEMAIENYELVIRTIDEA